ncbi:hypothetical protein CCP3SC1AL1_2570009 [Gammaproteobacteria bacterium]
MYFFVIFHLYILLYILPIYILYSMLSYLPISGKVYMLISSYLVSLEKPNK